MNVKVKVRVKVCYERLIATIGSVMLWERKGHSHGAIEQNFSAS